MVASVQKKEAPFISLDEYLAREEKADYKNEYFAGTIYMMAGGSPNHNRIATDVVTELSIQTRGTGCETFNSDQRIRLPSGLDTYPDAMVVCGDIEYDEEDSHAITNPVLLVEVLSPSTSSYDRAEKFEFYREAHSFKEYLTIHQDKVHIEHWSKQSNGQWTLSDYKSSTDAIALHSIDVTLSLEQLYARVEWENEPRKLTRRNGQ